MVQKSRVMEPDMLELSDSLPGWLFFGSFVGDGSAGGIVFGVAPRPRALYSRDHGPRRD